ncbi:MAG: hypothetical protein JWM60_1470 [Solirubrobacterales bacterium]|nr:hypothetical protein [Solirubrobacterales bacterium]
MRLYGALMAYRLPPAGPGVSRRVVHGPDSPRDQLVVAQRARRLALLPPHCGKRRGCSVTARRRFVARSGAWRGRERGQSSSRDRRDEGLEAGWGRRTAGGYVQPVSFSECTCLPKLVRAATCEHAPHRVVGAAAPTTRGLLPCRLRAHGPLDELDGIPRDCVKLDVQARAMLAVELRQLHLEVGIVRMEDEQLAAQRRLRYCPARRRR